MIRRSLPPTILAAVLLGCAPPIGGQPPTDESPPPTASVTASPGATTSPAPASPNLTTRPTAGSPTSQPTDRQPEPPPTARLTLADGTIHEATLGSYAYDGAAIDAPWLPAHILAAVELPGGRMLRLDLDRPPPFVRWGARYAAAQDEAADVITQLAAGGDGLAALRSAELPVPPSGEWVLMVQLYFAGEAGDAAYYWHLVVP